MKKHVLQEIFYEEAETYHLNIDMLRFTCVDSFITEFQEF